MGQNRLYADLHSHTTASDGVHAPEENVRMALAAGLSALAITDHDTVSGLTEAIAEGVRCGVQVVPGVEISTIANGKDIHILGYWIDYKQPLLLNRLTGLRETRNLRNDMMLERLRGLDMQITMAEVMAELKGSKGKDDTVGRPHIGAVLLRKGYVASISEAFEKYLGKSGAAYVNPPRILPAEAITWIREAGGAAVLAHPGIYDDDALVISILDAGIDGIEAYHADHSPEQESKYAALAKEKGLIVTAGSDFHGERGGELLHARIGDRKIETGVLDQLKKRGKQA
jgi:predicted metal-dependent phosphoesterase TrpH